MSAKSRVQSVISWLRAGYPEGVPGPDRVPLLALLRDTPLSEDEVKEVVRELSAHQSEVLRNGAVDYDEIEKFIEGVTHHEASPDNVKRVAATLAAAGWPLDNLD
jgi:hypothetical protein